MRARFIGAFVCAMVAVPPSDAQSGAANRSKVCAGCHYEIWKTYQRTGMARSFDRPAPENTIEDYAGKNTYHHAASGIDYEMLRRRDGSANRYFQRQSTIGFDGKKTNIFENQIDFIMGSGNHARTYLHRTSQGTLQQLPLAWYSENGGHWAMSPGYDRPDHQGFERNVTYDCMFCHNAYPEIPAGSGPRSSPVFFIVPEGIDCQRCHGDGARHVALAEKAAGVGEIRGAIFNPSRVAPERQLEVCAQCHLETTSSPLPGSIVRYERGPFSYKPGEPLSDFILHFDHAAGTGHDDKFEISSSVYRLRKSACFRKSNGALTCTTCHNPHEELRGDEAARHYNTVCRQCHGVFFARAVAAGSHTASPDCIGCHMPKRRTEDVVHVAMTDHYIQARRPVVDPFAARAETPVDANPYRGEVVRYDLGSRQPVPEDELYVAIAQVTQQSNLGAGIVRLRAAIDRFRPENAEYYLQLGDALSNAGRYAEAVPAYEQAVQRDPKSAATLERFALCLAALRHLARAETMLNQALELAPNSATTWILLGGVRAQQGKVRTSVEAFERALKIDPESPDAFNAAGAIWFELGDDARAETALRRAILLQPNQAPAHNNLGNLLSATDRFDQARFHFESALRIKPNYNAGRYDYALALAKVHRLDDAQTQLETILRVNPNAAAAHEFLGNILRAKGRNGAAIEHYRQALRIAPDFAHASLELGEALADSGDVAAARTYLQKVADGDDASTRAEARKLLEKLRKSQ